MKVLFLHNGGEILRGSELCLLSIIERIDPKAISPILLCNNEVIYKIAKEKNLEAYKFNFPEVTIDGSYIKVQLLKYIVQIIRLYWFTKTRAIRLIYSNSGLPTQLGWPVARLLKIPIITHIHAQHTRRYPWIWLFKFSDKVLFVSEAIRNELLSKVRFNGQIKVIYNGIDCSCRYFPYLRNGNELRNHFGIYPDDIVLGMTGALIHLKGGDIAIRALRKIIHEFPQVKLVFLGEGEARQDWSHLANSIGVADHVLFLGQTTTPELFYRELFDIHINASRSEALGGSIIEASACGLPIVASRVGGTPEIVEDGVTGYLFNKEDFDDLARKLTILINDRTLRLRMGRSGRERAVEKFNLDRSVQAIEREILEFNV
jgi:glycosyltransferase involved in cell wall biosynthesis